MFLTYLCFVIACIGFTSVSSGIYLKFDSVRKSDTKGLFLGSLNFMLNAIPIIVFAHSVNDQKMLVMLIAVNIWVTLVVSTIIMVGLSLNLKDIKRPKTIELGYVLNIPFAVIAVLTILLVISIYGA